MAQRWLELLFAHWPVPVDWLREQIPAGLDIDLFEGQAWLGVVPFRMAGVRPRFSPEWPWLSAFPELNLRTYVRHPKEGKPGVWFFSLDAGNPVAVQVARSAFHLPYYDARMSLKKTGPKNHPVFRYRSHRTHREAFPADLQAWYAPRGGVYTARKDSLEHWLTERYCLYTAHPSGDLIRAEIHHEPWPLQKAEAEFQLNTMTRSLGLVLPDTEPLLHFAQRLDVVVWAPQRLGKLA